MRQEHLADVQEIRTAHVGDRVVLISKWYEEKGFMVYYGLIEDAKDWITKACKKNGADSLRRVAKKVAARVFKAPDGSHMLPELIKDLEAKEEVKEKRI